MAVIRLMCQEESLVETFLFRHHIKENLRQKGRLVYLAEEDDIIGCMLFDHLRDVRLYTDDPHIAGEFLELAKKLCLEELIVHTPDLEAEGFDHQADGWHYRPKLAKLFRNYQEVADFITSQPGRVYSLDHFKAFMKRMGDPQFGLSCIHIGGTNGKGSTTNYIKSVLMKAGYKVGMFTSPAMVSRTEIIRVDDIAISEEWMVYYASRYLDDWLDARLSMFEIEMFIAVMYYLQHGVDVALFEVGLGGALDATNIIHPLLAVNTNIGLDHIDYLGDSYESIAENKAGIIKDGVDFMTGETREICLAVFRRIAMSHHSRVITIDPVDHYTVDEGISYHYHGHDVFLATDAVYQVDNSALAINVLEYIRPVFPFTEEHLIEGLKHAFWAGRYEVLSTKPLIVIDGAHNKEGMEALARSAKTLHHPHIIFTALRDKDTTHMLEILLTISPDVTVTEFTHVRAAKAADLAAGFPVTIDENWQHAVDEALQFHDPILITGSLYFIALVRPYVLKKLDHV